MEKTPTHEQLAFLTMLKSCLQDGLVRLTVKASPSHQWTQDGASKPTVNTVTEVMVDLGDECFEMEVGSHNEW